MAEKIWTATNIELGKLTIHRFPGPVIQIERRYKFLDGEGEIMEQIAGGRVLETISWSDIPANIQTALQEIDTWTKNRALQQEGMA